jgi:hypothetical protein
LKIEVLEHLKTREFMNDKYCFLFALFFPIAFFYEFALGQQQLLPLDQKINLIIGKEIYSLSSQAHTALQPYELSRIMNTKNYDSVLTGGKIPNSESEGWLVRKIFDEHLLAVRGEEFVLSFDFLPDVGLGYDLADQRTTWLNTRAFEFAGSIGSDFSFRTQYFESVAKFPQYLDDYVKQKAIIPGQGYKRYYSPNDYEYGYSAGTISYMPSRYLTIQMGQDKNFIGDGYRSLLLSDIATNYPFLKLNAYFWSLQYSIMWAQFQEPIPNGMNDREFWPKKYGAFHYLDWNVTNKFSIGFFEAVMWKAVDSVYGYRGFDLNYLVPLVLLRPIEYSMGSPDKMKIGLNLKYKITNTITSYGQLLIDEMTISEYVHDRGYWANKYGIQAGVKAFDVFDTKGLFLQSEFNTVSPYTYTHWDPLTSYSHYEQPLAHPLGANFYEWIGKGNFSINHFEFFVQMNYALYGADSVGVNYGNDIYKSYNTRVQDYGNYTTQGLRTTLVIADVRVAYVLNPLLNLRFELGILYRNESSVLSSNQSTWITFGIRSSFRNLYYDF